MSVIVDTSTLSNVQKLNITKTLTIQPTLSFKQKQKGAKVKPISMYSLRKAHIHIPYTYAANILGTPSNVDKVYPTIDLQFRSSLRDYQEPIVKEAVVHLNDYGTVQLNLYTGCGKTLLSSHLGCKIKKPIAVVHNIGVLSKQWKSTFLEHTNATVWVVGDEKQPIIPPDVIVVMVQRVAKIPQELIDRIGLLVLDETHRLCVPTAVAGLLAFSPRYIIGCSATPNRENGMERMIHSMMGIHEVHRPLSIKFNVVNVYTGITIKGEVNDKGDLVWSSVNAEMATNVRRNAIIDWLITNNLSRKILVLTLMKDHSTLIHTALTERGVNSSIMIGTSKTYSDANVLVGTISKLGTGFDELAACIDFSGVRIDTVMLTASIKSIPLITQIMGRAFRSKDPTVVDLCDRMSILQGHHKIRNAWYKSNVNGGNISTVHIDEEEEE